MRAYGDTYRQLLMQNEWSQTFFLQFYSNCGGEWRFCDRMSSILYVGCFYYLLFFCVFSVTFCVSSVHHFCGVLWERIEEKWRGYTCNFKRGWFDISTSEWPSVEKDQQNCIITEYWISPVPLNQHISEPPSLKLLKTERKWIHFFT